MELLVANLSGKVRKTKLQGRDYLVAPLSMIVPGVLNGSEGPLYYPLEEIARNPSDWNYMPIITPDHPMVNGKPVSARSPEILEKFAIGHVFNSIVNDKLDSEGWFDVERTRTIQPQVLMALEAGQPLELSTGLGTTRDNVAGVHNGKAYSGTARNYRPDHLAVLIGKEGACSRRDGCGVLVNEQSGGVLGKIANALGLEGLVKLANIVSASQEPVVTNKETEKMGAKLNPADRKLIVDNLVANCDCSGAKVWNEQDRTYLDSLPDERLTTLDESRKRVANTEQLVANSRKSFEHGESVFTFNAEKGTYDAKPKQPAVPVVNHTVKDGKACMIVNGKEFILNEVTGGYEPVTQAPVQPKTDAEYIAQAPPGVRSILMNAMTRDAQERTDLLAKILVNNRTGLTKEALSTLPLENDPTKGVTGLRALASMLTANVASEAPDPLTTLFNNYMGANGPAVTANSEEGKQDLLLLPTMDFSPAK